jgi:hypothetical protein
MHILEVGKPYLPGRRNYPEGADYNFRDGGHELRIFLQGATVSEIQAITSARWSSDSSPNRRGCASLPGSDGRCRSIAPTPGIGQSRPWASAPRPQRGRKRRRISRL